MDEVDKFPSRSHRSLLWWVPLIAALFFCLIGLGFWQLDRAGQKDALQAEFLERHAGAPVDLNLAGPLRHDAAALRWRQVSLEGQFASRQALLLDNRVREGVPGYFVYAFYRLHDEPLWVLINRGWMAAGAFRDRSPALPLLPEMPRRIHGRAVNPPSSGLRFDDPIWEELGPGVYRLPQLHLAQVAERLELKLLPFVVQLDPNLPGSLVRDWGAPAVSGARNRAYAGQWFCFAALLLIYATLILRRRGCAA